MKHEIILKGKIKLEEDGWSEDIYVGNKTVHWALEEKLSELDLDDDYITDNSDDDFDFYKSNVQIPECELKIYWANKPTSKENLILNHIAKMCGALECSGEETGYSEYTIMGFILDNFTIGNHDIYEILKGLENKYVIMIFKFN